MTNAIAQIIIFMTGAAVLAVLVPLTIAALAIGIIARTNITIYAERKITGKWDAGKTTASQQEGEKICEEFPQ